MSIRPAFTLDGIQLIGITGHARTGKDSVASYLGRTFLDTYSEPFARSLKLAAAEAFGIPAPDFFTDDIKETVNPYWGVSPRMIAQFVGTELFRDTLWKLLPADAQDFWVRRMHGKLSGECRGTEDGGYCAGDTVVISDVRLQNEYDYVIDNGGVMICLSREGADGAVGLPAHRSEQGIQHLYCKERTYELTNNGTLEELFAKVHEIVTKHHKLTPLAISNNL